MLMPDVTAILNDPEVGGGVGFQVIRSSAVRSRAGYNKTSTVYNATGNVQPQNMSNQPSTVEDLLDESIVVFSTFAFQTGSNIGTSIVEADIIVYNNVNWRVTRVDNWSEWGYTRAYATRVRDIVIPTPEPTDEATGTGEGV